MKKLVSFVVVIAMFLFLASCSSTSVEKQKSETEKMIDATTAVTTEPRKAVDELSEEEYEVFDALKIAAKTFKNPASLRLRDVGIRNEGNGFNFRIVELQGGNGFGGAASQVFDLHLKNSRLPNGTLDDSAFPIFSSDRKIDVGKINLALKEYWEEQGF